MEINEREARALLVAFQQAHCKDCDYDHACDHFDSFVQLSEAEQVKLLNKLNVARGRQCEPASDDWYIQQAIEQYASDEIEFDSALAPKISVGEDGAWVAAWVFVAKPDDDEDDEPVFASHLAARYDHDQNYLEGE